ncbi:MAG: insulinase family protein [Nitrospinae bacterium]|nr:insulinase family protein [Nitrospinota bacterium]
MMLKKAPAIAALLLCLATAAFAGQEAPQRPEGLAYPPLTFHLPKTVRVQLKNGMTLHLLEDHELPLVNIHAMVRIGSAWEPADKAGLASLTGSIWRAGGAEGLSPGALDEKLESMAAVLETSIGSESGTIALNVMTHNLDEGLRLFAAVIRAPAFDEQRFATLKSQMLENIAREEDDPETLVDREFRRLLFAGHAFGNVPDTASVKRIARADCAGFYRRHIGPESFIVAINGDFNADDMVRRFEALFEGFPPAAAAVGPLPELPADITPGVYLLNKPLPQTGIRMGHFGVSRKSPDFDAVRVMNYVVGGGGFASRMLKEIRTVRGLAYSVYSYFGMSDGTKGAFMAGGETKAASTHEFVDTARAIMRGVAADGITEAELAMAKEALINSFVFAFDKKADVAQRYAWMEYYGMPDDYLEGLRGRIQKVTMADVKRVARQYLQPDRMVIAALGDGKIIGEQLEKIGRVQTIEPAK